MVSLKYFHIYVLLLRSVGICPARFAREQQQLVVSVRDKFIAISITTITLIITECVLLSIIYMGFESDLNLYDDFKTGNKLFIFQLIFTSLIQIIESVFFFVVKYAEIEILNIICRHASIYYEKSSAGGRYLDQGYRWIFIFHIIMFIIHELNSLSTIWISDGISLQLLLCLAFVMTFRPLYSFIVMSSCTYVVYLICRFLAFYNDNLIHHLTKSKFPPRKNVQEILTLRAELISLTCRKLSQINGVAMLLETCSVLSLLPSFPAFMLMMFELNIRVDFLIVTMCCRALLWILAPILILLQALAINTINLQANRTVKILTKFPRTGNGMDTMVDKFLLKNVRKKPILTAYGFFPLDRSALFKLFTAIIMYIVILVQFKDIEQSLKKTR